MFICTFDIPLSVLIRSVGIGRYDVGRGYDNTVTLLEFAIEAKKFKKEWLVNYLPYECCEIKK